MAKKEPKEIDVTSLDSELAAAKAVEGSVDAATIYYSDYYDFQDDLTILAQDDGTLTGPIIYPVCQILHRQVGDIHLIDQSSPLKMVSVIIATSCIDNQ